MPFLQLPSPALTPPASSTPTKRILNTSLQRVINQKLNMMDNQATKIIKAYLAPQNVMLQLTKPHNHRVNAAKQAIQTFKNCFISALGTTDANFLIQLWDKLTPQVLDSIKLLRQSRVNPNHSAYEALKGPYNWNCYPMAPLGTKAIIYEDSNTHASWAPHGLDAWFLGPSKDHYRCHLYFVPETRGYRISGSVDLFPHHCSALLYSVDTHIKELSNELQDTFPKATRRERTLSVLRTLAQHLDAFISGTSLPSLPMVMLPQDKQRVTSTSPVGEQRVIPPLQRMPTTTTTLLDNNPTAP
jgi:hypothetical protein